jgi:hypothetical protein
VNRYQIKFNDGRSYLLESPAGSAMSLAASIRVGFLDRDGSWIFSHGIICITPVPEDGTDPHEAKKNSEGTALCVCTHSQRDHDGHCFAELQDGRCFCGRTFESFERQGKCCCCEVYTPVPLNGADSSREASPEAKSGA